MSAGDSDPGTVQEDSFDGHGDSLTEADHQSLVQRIEALESEVSEARRDAEAAKTVATRAQRQVTDLRAQRDNLEDRLDQELDDLRAEIDELRDRTQIFKHVQDVSGMDVDTRAALCVQTAYNAAQDDPNGTGYVTVQEAWKGQGCSIDRTRYYDVFRKAEELVADTDVCWFQKEERGHDPPSRLKVDLSDGRMPSQLEGVRLDAKGGQ
jgi:outer membrane murein-binding lipoprotein Lpp